LGTVGGFFTLLVVGGSIEIVNFPMENMVIFPLKIQKTMENHHL
jgi:hypothetical protein